MPKRNPKSQCNHAKSTDISTKENEIQVVAWLRATGGTLESFEVKHLTNLSGTGGDYEFDAIAEFTILNGAHIVVVVECKRYGRPVEREKLLSLWAKQQDVKANKAMMFATCGFQSGALKYANTYNIATVTFVKGDFLYETRSDGPSMPPPPWAGLTEYAGMFMNSKDGKIYSSSIDIDDIDVLSEWIQE